MTSFPRTLFSIGITLVAMMTASLAVPASTLAGTHVLDARLAQRIGAAVGASGMSGSTSVVVWNQRSLDVVYQHAPRKQVVPASNMKLLTSAALLAHFGPDHRFTTRVGLFGRQDGSRWIGSIVLIGGGDPSLSTRRFANDNYHGHGASIELLALPIRAMGIRTVTGRIYAVSSYLSGPRYVSEWPGRYHGVYSGPISGLTVNQSSTGRWVGSRPSSQPALFAAEAYRHALKRAGVTVRGGTLTQHPRQELEIVGEVESPPLWRLLDHLNTQSDNFYAEVLLRDLGRDKYGPGNGTTPRGRTAGIQTLRALGLDTTGVRWVDGSGLSGKNRVTARFMSHLLGVGHQAEWGPRWIEGFAVSGRSGTLRKRMRSAPFRGSVFAKTGTLNNASALSGFAERSGPRDLEYGFAVLTSRPSGGSINSGGARSLQDRIASILVR